MFSFSNSVGLDCMIGQGAEAVVYRTSCENRVATVKERREKPYFHPDLQSRLIRQRLLREAKILKRCSEHHVKVPTVYYINPIARRLTIEWIPGSTVAVVLKSLECGNKANNNDFARKLGESIGASLAAVHTAGVIHGDLAGSNMVVKDYELHNDRDCPLEIFLIDFGLSFFSNSVEDAAVDLYSAQKMLYVVGPTVFPLLNEGLLESYCDNFRSGVVVMSRLNEVSLRGRKR